MESHFAFMGKNLVYKYFERNIMNKMHLFLVSTQWVIVKISFPGSLSCHCCQVSGCHGLPQRQLANCVRDPVWTASTMRLLETGHKATVINLFPDLSGWNRIQQLWDVSTECSQLHVLWTSGNNSRKTGLFWPRAGNLGAWVTRWKEGW